MRAANTKIRLFQRCSFSDAAVTTELLLPLMLAAFFLAACSGYRTDSAAKEGEAILAENSQHEKNALEQPPGSDIIATEQPLRTDPADGGEYTEPSPVKAPQRAKTVARHSEPSDDQIVKVTDYIPSILTDLKYSTRDNFTGEVIYDFTEAYLRYGTVKKLRNAQQALLEEGYCLKIWDAFRPPAAQFKLWEICPNAIYVANPNKGYSSHSKGNTVDITLLNADGTEIPMPTGFDDFSAKADRDYSDCTEEEANHARLLEAIMQQCGFTPYFGEWWHFSDQTDYDVDSVFMPN